MRPLQKELHGSLTIAQKNHKLDVAFPVKANGLIQNAGTHSELIRLSWEDFVRLAKPRVLKFSSARTGTTAA